MDPEFWRGPWLALIGSNGLHAPPAGSPFTTSEAGTSTHFASNLKWVLDGGHVRKVAKALVLVTAMKRSSRNALCTLKDPWGEMEGLIHYKALSEHGADISVGAALELVSVSVLKPGPGCYRLSITRRNLAKVFPSSTPLPVACHVVPRRHAQGAANGPEGSASSAQDSVCAPLLSKLRVCRTATTTRSLSVPRTTMPCHAMAT